MTVGLALSLAIPGQALGEPVLNDRQKEVWQGEVNYWKYVNGRDHVGYMTMWLPEFRGWPCNTEHPADISGLSKWSEQWFAQKTAAGEVTVPEVEAVVVEGDFAITYLSARTDWNDPNGVRQSKLEKFVHTWKATDHGWKIIGGMCAPLERASN